MSAINRLTKDETVLKLVYMERVVCFQNVSSFAYSRFAYLYLFFFLILTNGQSVFD